MAKMKKMAMGGMGQPLTAQLTPGQGGALPAAAEAAMRAKQGTPPPTPTSFGQGPEAEKLKMAAQAADAQARMGPPPTGLRRPAAQPVPRAMSTAGRAMGRNMGSETEGGGGGMGFRKEMMDQMSNRKPPSPQAPAGMGSIPSQAAQEYMKSVGAKGGQSSAASPQMEAARTAQAANQQASMMKNLGGLGGATMKKGGAVKKAAAKKAAPVKKMASGGMTSSASRRGDGIASKGKTRGRIC